MASFNKVILMGNLTQDPELKQTATGVSVCSFTIAVNRRFGKNEQGQQTVDFFNIVAWRQTAEFVNRFFKKGNPILVCGQLQTRSWTDNQGNKRTAVEVVADEAAFVAPAQATAPTDTSKEQLPPDPRQWGRGATYTPDAYKQTSIPFSTPASQQFEEIPNDEDLPF